MNRFGQLGNLHVAESDGDLNANMTPESAFDAIPKTFAINLAIRSFPVGVDAVRIFHIFVIVG